MAAGSASDIPDSKSDYCPCNRCTVARKQGRQEIITLMHKVAQELQDEYDNDFHGMYQNDTDGFSIASERILKALERQK